MRKSISTQARHSNAPRTTIYYQHQGRPSKKATAKRQQYLSPAKEKALINFLLQMSASGSLIRIKYIPSLAFYIARQRIIKRELRRPDILLENVYNIDKTRVTLSMLGTIKVLIGKDNQRDYKGAGVKRIIVTAIEYVSASIFDPQTKARANYKPRLLIYTSFSTYKTLEVLKFYFKTNITLYRLPSYTSHKLQPYNTSVFGPLKTTYRDQVERLYRGGLTNINKEHFTTIYSLARESAITKKNILAGWAKTRLFPFNPERVLRDLTKLDAPLAVENNCGDTMQGETTQTPVTPVSTEALIGLLDQIKHSSYNGDERGKARHERLVQKLANTAQRSFAQQALDQNYIRILKDANNEAKTRRKTKSEILQKVEKDRKGRVVSYNYLETVRADRARKKVAQEAKEAQGKGKRSRQKAATEADEAGVSRLTISGLQRTLALYQNGSTCGTKLERLRPAVTSTHGCVTSNKKDYLLDK
ncbi:hypothetical protein COCVIDRAFT_32618 [Bipolaris victoriae FI3]|uniref:DDE-1 domain-containing protein n=1 Tax=Bipolaris victoriae (strain FI3) TaxID=930091 RepID=W7ERV2_BIPV3|nr:hypothetical protein COCVIDRAFT_32618 [Bipolaris victoriae FI3]